MIPASQTCTDVEGRQRRDPWALQGRHLSKSIVADTSMHARVLQGTMQEQDQGVLVKIKRKKLPKKFQEIKKFSEFRHIMSSGT
jgi:hypothetical protein